MKVKNRIKWKVIDKLLEETESSPWDLLDWLEWGFENVGREEFICHRKLYLGKFYIEWGCDAGIHTDSDDEIDVFCSNIFTGSRPSAGELSSPAAAWHILQTDLDFRTTMIKRFKKHYKLK